MLDKHMRLTLGLYCVIAFVYLVYPYPSLPRVKPIDAVTVVIPHVEPPLEEGATGARRRISEYAIVAQRGSGGGKNKKSFATSNTLSYAARDPERVLDASVLPPRGWAAELLSSLKAHPKGVLLVDTSPRDSQEDVVEILAASTEVLFSPESGIRNNAPTGQGSRVFGAVLRDTPLVRGLLYKWSLEEASVLRTRDPVFSRPFVMSALERLLEVLEADGSGETLRRDEGVTLLGLVAPRGDVLAGPRARDAAT